MPSVLLSVCLSVLKLFCDGVFSLLREGLIDSGVLRKFDCAFIAAFKIMGTITACLSSFFFF